VTPEVLPAGCTAPSPATTFTCDLGNVAPNTTVRREIEFQSPAACATSSCTLTFQARVTFARQHEGDRDEDEQRDAYDKRATLTDTSTIHLFSSADRIRAEGTCVPPSPAKNDEQDARKERDDHDRYPDRRRMSANETDRDQDEGRHGKDDRHENDRSGLATLGALANRSANQATRVTFGPAAAALPCTPAAAGVDPQVAPTPLHTKISFVFLPQLQQLATVQESFFNLPAGVNPDNFVLYELVNYNFGSSVSASNRFFPVPACQNGQVPAGGPSGLANVSFDSCVAAKAAYGDGGVIVTLHVNPTGDPGYSG
jgi:hypothetical protein